MLHESTILSYLQMGHILLREAYIASTRRATYETSGDSDKLCSFKFTYKAISDVEDLHLPTTHTHISAYWKKQKAV